MFLTKKQNEIYRGVLANLQRCFHSEKAESDSLQGQAYGLLVC